MPRKNAEPYTAQHLNALGCKLGLPVCGTFELTARCNFNCRMCYVHLKNDAAELKRREFTADEWLNIARQAKDMGLMFLLLTGGEPLIRDDFPYLYEELSKMGFVISLNSNASLYNDKISELFRKYPPSRINVTLYGGCEDTYASLCGNPSFEKVVGNLKRMKADGLQVSLNVSLTPYNVGDIERIAAISKELGLHAKASSYMYPPVRVDGSIGENAARFSPEEAGRVIAKWYSLVEDEDSFKNRALAIKQGLETARESHCEDPDGRGVKCRAGRSTFWITWEGKMTACGTMDSEGFYLRETGFKEAWEGVLRSTAKIELPEECCSCKDRSYCGVCASICKGETGRFDGKPEYLCKMTAARAGEIFRIAGIDGENNED